MLEAGDFIGAIRLATSYYLGGGEKVTIGLPEDDKPRHTIVQGKLMEMMSASLQYAFGQDQQTGSGRQDDSQLTGLAEVCVAACLVMEDTGFLFDEVFSWYDEYEKASVFVDVLEPYVLDRQIVSIPPAALKALVEQDMTTHEPASLEEIICCLDTSTMDIDQVTSLCKKHNLYDAFVYVWTTALGDYIGPVQQLLGFSRGARQRPNPSEDADPIQLNAMKIFPYLSFTLTGRIYPTGSEMALKESSRAKEQLYGILFSGASGPTNGGASGPTSGQSFPLLRELLLLDTSSSMSLFNEALEDSFLNMPDDDNGSLDQLASPNGVSPTQGFTRQFIIAVLLEIMSTAALGPEDTIFIDMFVARSLPKYPQDLVLPGSTLDEILVRLCHFSELDTSEDCQLSVEYLLSVYHPPDLRSFVPLFKAARFFRVLRSVYRSEGHWSELVLAYFLDDQDQDGAFDVIHSCLRKGSGLSPKQQRAVRDTVQNSARELANLDVHRTARLVAEVMPESQAFFLSSLEGDSHLQYRYLDGLFRRQDGLSTPDALSPFTGHYIQLMCQYKPLHVADYVNSLRDVDLQLEDVLPSMEAGGIVDGAVILMTRQGRVQDAMQRLTKHLNSLEVALSGLLHDFEQSPDGSSTNEAMHDLLGSITKYSGVGIWLCQHQTKAARRSPLASKPWRKSKRSLSQSLSFEEKLWLQLIDATVSTAKTFSHPQAAKHDQATVSGGESDLVATTLRMTVQNVFTALLQATTAFREQPGRQEEFSFLQILRAFLTQAAASSPSLAELRGVIASIFSAYAYEESLLALANSMLDKDLYVHVDEVSNLRQRGWRPRGQVCEICRRRVWGPGAGSQVWESWVEEEERRQAILQEGWERVSATDDQRSSGSKGKGKGKAMATATAGRVSRSSDPDILHSEGRQDGEGTPVTSQALVFACRHLFHRGCFDQIHGGVERVCPICKRKPVG
jgi:vacuolar protein sorting-associated protein 8